MELLSIQKIHVHLSSRMAAHRHFTLKLLMKWSGSDGLQPLNWRKLKLLVLWSQVSKTNHHCYWHVWWILWLVTFKCVMNIQQTWWYSWTYIQDLKLVVIHFNAIVLTFGDWLNWMQMRTHGWWVGFFLSSCCCTGHTLLGQAVTSVKWGWLLSCYMGWDTPLII